ncbi:MAG: hypothetical protein HW377_2266, partial [Actinobacteria bacterium]|nr:hypothetical protein [Actinomycetota bacterium]
MTVPQPSVDAATPLIAADAPGE